MWQLFGRRRIVMQHYYYRETDSYLPYGFFLDPFTHYHFVYCLHMFSLYSPFFKWQGGATFEYE